MRQHFMLHIDTLFVNKYHMSFRTKPQNILSTK